MEILAFFVKGILIGLLVGIPFGVVGTLMIGRCLNDGWKAGLITGLGSSVADCIYAGIGAFGLTMISDFLLKQEKVIHFVGGGIVLAMGISAILKEANGAAGTDRIRTDGINAKPDSTTKLKIFLSAFSVGITNPTVILIYLFLFSYLDLSAGMNPVNGILMVAGVFVGTFIWWLLMISAVGYLRERAVRYRKMVNRILGVLLIIFGLLVWISIFFVA